MTKKCNVSGSQKTDELLVNNNIFCFGGFHASLVQCSSGMKILPNKCARPPNNPMCESHKNREATAVLNKNIFYFGIFRISLVTFKHWSPLEWLQFLALLFADQRQSTNDKQWQTTNNDKHQKKTNNDKQQTTTNDQQRQTANSDKWQTTTNDKQQQTTSNKKRQTKLFSECI